MNNICLFCWLNGFEHACNIYNAFIDYNFDIGGLHRIGAMWIAFHVWTDLILLIMLGVWLKERIKNERHR